MAKKDRLTLRVSVEGATTYDGDIVAYTFGRDGIYVDRAAVEKGSVKLPFGADHARTHKVLFGPSLPDDQRPSIQGLRRLSAFEAVLTPGSLVDHIRIPGTLVNFWPFCLCWVTGRVLKDGRPVCDARVHVCEVDRINWLLVLPDRDLFGLRDDLLKALNEPPKIPPPRPQADPTSFPSTAGPSFDLDTIAFDSQPKLSARPKLAGKALIRPIDALQPQALTALTSTSVDIVRSALIDHFDLFYPFICLWPTWWRYRCDEIAVRTTDSDGRFSVLTPYNCTGDKPDIYVWVEFQIGGVWETVHRRPIACNTHWNYACGNDIVINVVDPRVPTCDPETDPPGCQVAVLSIGRNASLDCSPCFHLSFWNGC